MTTFDWQTLLTEWSAALLADDELVAELPPEVIAAGWLSYPPATEEQIAAVEARLGVTFPHSYRAFLQVSNGWRMTGSFVSQLWNTEQIGWYRDQDPETVAIWANPPSLFDLTTASARAYLESNPLTASLIANLEQFPPFPLQNGPQTEEGRYIRSTLAVSAYDDGIYLLNPEVVDKDGEWEAWFFAPWVPGAQRYDSFWALMQEKYRSFVDIQRSERGEPTPHADPALGIAANDRDGLVAALASPDEQRRFLALTALGNLRDPQTFPAILAVFQNPDEGLFVREQAARTLGELRDPRAVQPLIDAFRPPSRPYDQLKMKHIVGDPSRYGIPTDEPGLANLTVADMMQQMQSIFGSEVLSNLMAGMSGGGLGAGIGDHLHHAVRQGLLGLGEVALPGMLAALSDPDPTVRQAIAHTLPYVRGNPTVLTALTAALSDPDAEVRAAIAASLDQLYLPAAVTPLLEMLSDPVARVRTNAITGLCSLFTFTSDARIPPALTALQSHDADPQVRQAAAEGLARIKQSR